MIIHGLKHSIKIIHREKLYYNCPDCNKLFSLELRVYQNYVTFFLIPLFPTFKIIDVSCKNCHVTKPIKKMPETVQLQYANNKVNIRTPKWMFSGSIVLLISIFILYIFGSRYHELQVKKMLKIKSGSICGHRLWDDNYMIYKLYMITNDTFYYKRSKEIFKSKGELKEFLQKVDSNYSDENNKMTRNEYFDLVDKNDIFEIDK